MSRPLKPSDPELRKIADQMLREGKEPCEIIRRLMTLMQVGKYGEVPVIEYLVLAYSVNMADVMVVGTWHELGNGTMSDQTLNGILAPIMNSKATGQGR